MSGIDFVKVGHAENILILTDNIIVLDHIFNLTKII